MGPKSLFSMAACCALCFGTAAAQELHSPSSLDAALYRLVCERVQAPIVFSTRDTLFALSLPTDEPAQVYLQLTVRKNGKVKEKETRVHANHIAGYVAPAFVAATKDLRIDKSLLGNLSRKDTSVLLTFPLEYQCALDTIMKVWPDASEGIATASFYQTESSQSGYMTRPRTTSERDQNMLSYASGAVNNAQWEYINSKPTRVWYYLAFIKEPQE